MNGRLILGIIGLCGLVALSQGVTLLVMGSGAPMPRQAAPVQPQLRQVPDLVRPSVWQFADIRVTVLGPSIVKIDWMPLTGADEYRVYRNGVQIGPAYLSAPTATQPITANDSTAPAGSTLSYYVTAAHKTTVAGLPGTPNAGKSVVMETLMQTSKPVSVVTPVPLTSALAPAVLTPIPARTGISQPYTGLTGWVDLHAHPMTNLAFGGKLIQGGLDIGSLLPTDSQCNQRVRAGSLQQALGDDRPSHGGWDAISFRCGDALRPVVIGALQGANHALVTAGIGKPPALGYPNFETWPAWNDITHQKMWWEWIRRARDGGQRVMVALATNNRTLGDAVSGPGDLPTDDKSSADMQINEIKLFVSRHADFMEVALTAADLKRIVQSNKIAVVLGVEIDNIGNFNLLPAAARDPGTMSHVIPGEIQRLYDEGVRYVLPIHVVDNIFGGTSIYTPSFNLANFRETNHWWSVECSAKGEDIDYKLDPSLDPAIVAGALLKIGMDPTNKPTAAPTCPQPNMSQQGVGHRNLLGLTDLGELAVKEMMKRGMIIDIDHMSNKAADRTLDIAERVSAPGYPIVSGHAGVRGVGDNHSERQRSKAQLLRIARLHGMFGLGSDGTDAYSWSRFYQMAMNTMGYMSDDPNQRFYQNGAIAFGTDLNGLARAPVPGGHVTYDASFPRSGIAGSSRTWDYNTEGVAHYGMLADFIHDVHTSPSLGYTNASGAPKTVTGADLVDNHLFRSADYFWHMWEQCEAQKVNVH